MDALNFLGLLDDANTINQRRNRMKRFLGATCSAVLILPSLVAFMTNLDDPNQALEALYFLSVQLLVNAQFWCILTDLQVFNEIWNQVESMVFSRTASGHGKSYLKADQLFRFLKKLILVIFLATVSCILAPPLMITIYNSYNHELMETSLWNSPFLLAFPFSTSNAFAYTLVYIASCVSLVSNMICKIAIQDIFIRTGFHLIAGCHDIRDSLSCVDTIYDRRDSNNSKNATQSTKSYEVKCQVKDIIKYHGELNNLFRSFSAAISGIIFFEYTVNILLLGSVGVFIAQDANFWSLEGRMLKFKLIWISALGSLFISSLLGTEITYQRLQVANYIYLPNWHNWPMQVKRFILMVLMVVQMDRRIYGYGIFLCDLETFKETMHTVFTVIIILKQMN